ncbi:hypothetical protein MKX08_008099 [Trichoderma sp. CBMAI-0020]|nr:hypothetical protein MKX08_008099 [Trichoderma sp. CBMAI-0020]
MSVMLPMEDETTTNLGLAAFRSRGLVACKSAIGATVVGNDDIEVADAIRDARDTRESTGVVGTVNLDDEERALSSVRKP